MGLSRASRAGKGFLAAALATFVALFGHVAAGGAMPSWLGVAAPLILSTAVCVPLAGRRLSPVRVSLSVAVAQVLFHFLFVLGAPTPGAHVHTGMSAMPASDAAVLETGAMGLGHILAAAVTISALVWGEFALLQVLSAMRHVIRRVLLPLSFEPEAQEAHRTPSASSGLWVPTTLQRTLSVASRRGPPALCA